MSPTCPECGREHLNGLRFRHTATCSLYRADSRTIAADHDRGNGTRPATNTEHALLKALGYPELPTHQQYGIRFAHSGWHTREPLVLDAHGATLHPATPQED